MTSAASPNCTWMARTPALSDSASATKVTTAFEAPATAGF